MATYTVLKFFRGHGVYTTTIKMAIIRHLEFF